ncbi:MAG: LysE family translocator [Gemmatimonadaceae bacterium]
MPTVHSLVLFMAAGLALNLTPGPDMLYVAARSTTEGRLAGVVSAIGIGAGTLVHIAALALGLSALLTAVPVAYQAVRFAGAAYLIYLGVRALLRPNAPAAAPNVQRASLGAVFRQGVVTNVLNPKVALFFLAFLPQFVDPSRGNPVVQTTVLGLMFDAQGTLVNVAVALGASAAGDWLRGRDGGGTRAAAVLGRVTGVIFIGLGARLALASRK